MPFLLPIKKEVPTACFHPVLIVKALFEKFQFFDSIFWDLINDSKASVLQLVYIKKKLKKFYL